jgi:hypothetical protein
MTISEIQSYIGTIGQDPSLFEERNFAQRIEVIDFIGFPVMDRVGDLLQKADRVGESQKMDQARELMLLKQQAERVRAALEAVDNRLFQRLRASIGTGVYTGKAFKDMVAAYVDLTPDDDGQQEGSGYDNLDIFTNGLFLFEEIPEQTRELEPEMVYYQKTPARVVFELAAKTRFMATDVFFDLGSGLGQVAILVHLLAGIRVIGVELEPAFCGYARNCAAALHLTDVEFVNADARKADYSRGTIFFMFTPFRGAILREVLEMLRKEALARKITILTYGPCSAEVAAQGWLYPATADSDDSYTLRVFSSRSAGPEPAALLPAPGQS